MEREYSDFFVIDPPWRPMISRRQMFVGCSALIGMSVSGTVQSPAQGLLGLANGLNAVMGLVTNFDALAGKAWSKVEGFFDHGKSNVSSATVSRIGNEVENLLSDENNVAVSITENRTPSNQSGVIRHHFSQNFSQAYVDWCTCNAQMYSNSAAMWRQAAAALRARGDNAGSQAALAKASQDQAHANGFIRKMTDVAAYDPVHMELPPSKPSLAALPAHPKVVAALDKGDYFVCHATASASNDARVSYLT